MLYKFIAWLIKLLACFTCSLLQGKYQIGHPGYGGQNAKYDPHNKLSFAYLHNGLLFTGIRAESFIRLEEAVYKVLKSKQ